jgi:hypothetical protein
LEQCLISGEACTSTSTGRYRATRSRSSGHRQGWETSRSISSHLISSYLIPISVSVSALQLLSTPIWDIPSGGKPFHLPYPKSPSARVPTYINSEPWLSGALFPSWPVQRSHFTAHTCVRGSTSFPPVITCSTTLQTCSPICIKCVLTP